MLQSILPCLLLVCIVCPAQVAAQGVQAPTTGTGDARTGRQSATLADSFEALPHVIKTGQEVKVRGDGRRATKGSVVSVTGDQLVIARRQYPFPNFRPRKDEAFSKDVVQSIDVVDSSWNGALMGAAAGVGFLAATIELGCSATCDNVGSWVIGGLIFVPLGTAAGGLVDSLRNRRVYERAPERSRVTIVPALGRSGVAIVAHVHFGERARADQVKRWSH